MLINAVVRPKQVQKFPVKDIVPPKDLPVPTEEAVKLAIDIGVVISPLLLEQTSDGYEVLMGDENLAIAIKAGLKNVPVIILPQGTDRATWTRAFGAASGNAGASFSERLVEVRRLSSLGWSDVEIMRAMNLSPDEFDKFVNCLGLPAELIQRAIADEVTVAALVALSKAPAEVKANATKVDGRITNVTVRELIGMERTRRADMQPSLLSGLVEPYITEAVARGDSVKAIVIHEGGKVECLIPVDQVLGYAKQSSA